LDLFNSLLYIYIYSWPPCGSTLVLPSYLLLWHSCTWDKTSTLWSCQVFGAVAKEVNYCINFILFFFFFHFYLIYFCFFLFFCFFLSFFCTCMRVWSHILSDKTNVKVRGSTNDILNKYNINSFYYSTGNHTQRKFQSDDLSLLAYYKLLTWSY